MEKTQWKQLTSPQMSSLSQPCNDDHCSCTLGSSKNAQGADANWFRDCIRKLSAFWAFLAVHFSRWVVQFLKCAQFHSTLYGCSCLPRPSRNYIPFPPPTKTPDTQYNSPNREELPDHVPYHPLSLEFENLVASS